MVKELSMVTLSPKNIYIAEKNKQEKRMFIFDILWYITTAAASAKKLYDSCLDNNNVTDALMFLLLFAIPILVKHFIALDLYKTLKDQGKMQLISKVLYYFFNCIFLVSFFLLIFIMMTENSEAKMTNFRIIVLITMHIATAFVGIYDKLAIRWKPREYMKE